MIIVSLVYKLGIIINSSSINSEYKGSVNVSVFKHDEWRQPSVITRIEGSEPKVVILGAHLDSIQEANITGWAPGADDNASGSAVLLEAFNAILESGFIPKKTIEFHWYSGEEEGLLGSQEIAEQYYHNKVHVNSMLNFDCVGYKSNLTEDEFFVRFRTGTDDPEFRKFLQMLTEGYLKVNWTTSECGFPCSDHTSWDLFGFSSASPAEPIGTPNRHTASDALETLDFDMIKKFAKLAVAYLIEIAEPRT